MLKTCGDLKAVRAVDATLATHRDHWLINEILLLMARTARVTEILAAEEPFDATAAAETGLVTAAVDEIDWDDELCVATEERASLSPEALTGLEANLRFAGAETADSKVFGRLSAWQNWIFARPNAVGTEAL